MKCPKCGKNLPFGAVACGNCGAKFKTAKCPHCGRDILPGLPYCPGCQKDIKWNSANPGTMPAPNKKKPLTKQWWFWTVCVVLVIGILGNIYNAFTGTPNGQSQTASSPSASPNSNIFLTAPAGKGDVMNGTKTEKIGEWGYIQMKKADAKSAGMDDFIAFTDTFESKGFNWCSIIFEDGTGICFPGGNSMAGSYGTVDQEGCIIEAAGDIVLEADGKSYSYLPRDDKADAKASSEPVQEPTAEPTPAPTPAPTDKPQSTLQSDSPADSDNQGNSNFNIYDNSSRQQTEANYVLNTNSLKIHHPSCQAVKKIAPQNYQEFTGSIDDLLSQGYTTCGICFK